MSEERTQKDVWKEDSCRYSARSRLASLSGGLAVAQAYQDLALGAERAADRGDITGIPKVDQSNGNFGFRSIFTGRDHDET